MTKVRLMAADASPALTDLFYMVIDPSTSPADRKVTGTAAAIPLATAPAFTGAFVAGQTDAVITGSARIPFSATTVVDGPTAIASGSSNVVGAAVNTELVGNFTGITGSDPGKAWGFNVFATVGATAGDGAGLTDVTGSLIELSVKAPSGTFAVARGFMAEVALYGAAAGATITQAESLRVGSPKRKNGATGGTITNAYSLFVEEAAFGTNRISMFVEGGVSRFGGRVDTAGTIASTTGDLSIFAGFAATDGARLGLSSNANGGHIFADLRNSGAAFRVYDGTDYMVALFRLGHVYLHNSVTPPGTPTLGGHIYVESGALKYKGSSGTVTVLAAA